jgi:hypothetical protein
LLPLLAAAGAVVAGCGGDGDETGTTRARLHLPERRNVTVVLLARNGSRAFGKVTLEWRRATAIVVLREARRAEEPLPVHVHTGSCAASPTRIAERLNDVRNGRSVTELRTNWIASTQPFSVDVHGARRPHRVVACADFK